jgi:hypothetical protein|tara:strand:+ start:3501 stop:3650 length:150 start_codon:yes stop_codon:yes gene_type:complete
MCRINEIKKVKMKRKREMKKFLLNYKGNKYKANNLVSLLWNFATGNISK